MTSTVITHVYNEEFLLPYWLSHHQRIFDHGIVIDYASTDASVSIVREMAPTWEVRQSSCLDFSARTLDEQVEAIEAELSGAKIALTVTEFFVGSPSALIASETAIPTVDLIDMPDDKPFIEGVPFHEQRTHGIHYLNAYPFRAHGRGRLLHYSPISYPLGRHYDAQRGGPFLIYRVASCLVNDAMIDRRLQIQSRIPTEDVTRGYGVQHHDHGRGLTRDKILDQLSREREIAVDLSSVLLSAVRRQYIDMAMASEDKSYLAEVVGDLVRERDELLFDRDDQCVEREKDGLKHARALSELNQAVSELKAVLNALELRLSSCEHENVELRKAVAYFSNERDLLLRDKEELIAACQDLQKLTKSFSWKVTKPLRALGRVIRFDRQRE
jgi:hypothetical protein